MSIDKDYMQGIGEMHKNGMPVIGIVGAGTLGSSFAEGILPRSGNNVIWYNRTWKNLYGAREEVLGHIVRSGSILPGDDVSQLSLASAAEVAAEYVPEQEKDFDFFTYQVTPGGREIKVAIVTDPSLFKATIHLCNAIYFTIGRSEHSDVAGIQTDREVLLRENIQILADNIFQLGIPNAAKALHMVAVNPDNILARAYHELSGLSEQQVVSLGPGVDSDRLATIIARRYSLLKGTHFDRATMFGNHGKDAIVIPQRTAMLGGNLLNFLMLRAKGQTGAEKLNAEVANKVAEEIELLRDRAMEAGMHILGSKRAGTALGQRNVAMDVAKVSILRQFQKDLDPEKGETDEVVLGISMPTGQYGIQVPAWLGHTARITTRGHVEFLPAELTLAQQVEMLETANRLHELYMKDDIQAIITKAKANQRIYGSGGGLHRGDEEGRGAEMGRM